MIKHHRGNVTILHNTVQNMLVDVLEKMGRRVFKEYVVPRGHGDKNYVVDVCDYSSPKAPVYYEVEDKGRTRRFVEKEAWCAHYHGRDIILIDLRQMKKDCSDLKHKDMVEWLRERVI